MRVKERIPIALGYFIEHPEAFKNFTKSGDKGLKSFYNNIEFIIEEWQNYHEERFGQFLYEREIIYTQASYDYDECEWLVDNGYVKAEDILFFPTTLNNSKAKYALLKDFDIEYIEKIMHQYKIGNIWLSLNQRVYFNSKLAESLEKV